MARLDAALVDFTHRAAGRELKWDLAAAGWTLDYLGHIPDRERREVVSRLMK